VFAKPFSELSPTKTDNNCAGYGGKSLSPTDTGLYTGENELQRNA